MSEGAARARLDAYGDGGFRIAGVRHDGSVLIINGVAQPWPVLALADAAPDAFDRVFAADPAPDLVLLGTGARLIPPREALLARFRDAAMGLEFMDTGAACRVYATLAADGRRVAAALIAV